MELPLVTEGRDPAGPSGVPSGMWKLTRVHWEDRRGKPRMLTHVGLGASHGGSLLSSFQDCGDVEVCDVHVPCRKKMQLSSTVDVCALSLCD